MRLIRLIAAFSIVSAGWSMTAADTPPPTTEMLLQEAKKAFRLGQREEAMRISNRMVEQDPQNPNCYFMRARLLELEGRREAAVDDYSQIIELIPFTPEARYHRGTQYFLLGRIPESVADFEVLVEQQPDRAAYQWQRGIALYYDGKYEKGRKQFELHQTVNPHDVENSIWHFMCVARVDGVEAARQSLLPVTGDRRVPMAQVLKMFAGELTPTDVLEAAEDSSSPPNLIRIQQLYAHLYIALLYEAEGNRALVRKHLQKAVDLNLEREYMWEVARVHLELLDSGKLK